MAKRAATCPRKLAQIRSVLFPGGKTDKSWDADTMDEVARIVGFPSTTRPKRRRRRR